MTAPADLDRRFYAYAIDHAIAWGVDAAAAVVLVQVLPGRVRLAVAAILGVVLLVGAVFALVLGRTGSSPGMAVAGIRVVLDGTDAPIGVRRALLRQLVLGVAGLPTLGLGLAALGWTAAMDPSGRRRGWHDHLTHSFVADARPVEEEPAEPEEAHPHVVNLTALRLVPAPAPDLSTPIRRPATPPPAGPPTPRHVAPTPAPGREPVPEREPVPVAARATDPEPVAAVRPPAARQQLGYPLLPEPRPDATPDPGPQPTLGGAHAARGVAVVEAPRWRVVFDTGESFTVEGLALVGRRPEGRNGEQVRHLVPLHSADMSLSKTHAQLQVAPDGALVVMDRGSTNGSFLVRQGVPRGLPAGRATTLVDGDHVRFGDREMTVVRDR